MYIYVTWHDGLCLVTPSICKVKAEGTLSSAWATRETLSNVRETQTEQAVNVLFTWASITKDTKLSSKVCKQKPDPCSFCGEVNRSLLALVFAHFL